MQDLTFGEQVKIILSRKDMTIKELARKVEARTGKKMSRQNLTQRLGRDNFQERDMRMIAEILGCPFQLNILDERTITESETQSGQSTGIEAGAASAAGQSAEKDLAESKAATAEKEISGKAASGEGGEKEQPEEKVKTKEPHVRTHERDITIGELVDIHEELDALMQKAAGETQAEKELETRQNENQKEGNSVSGEGNGKAQTVEQNIRNARKEGDEQENAASHIEEHSQESKAGHLEEHPQESAANHIEERSQESQAGHSGEHAQESEAGHVGEYVPESQAGFSEASPQGGRADYLDDNVWENRAGHSGGQLFANVQEQEEEYESRTQASFPEGYGEPAFTGYPGENGEGDMAEYPSEPETGHVEELLQEIESIEKTEKKEPVQEEKTHGWRAYLKQRFKKLGREQSRTEKDAADTGREPNVGRQGQRESANGSFKNGHPEENDPEGIRMDGDYPESRYADGEFLVASYGEDGLEGEYSARAYVGGYSENEYSENQYSGGRYEEEYLNVGYPKETVQEEIPQEDEEDKGDLNPYTGKEYETNSVRMHPARIGYVQVYDRANHQWTDMTEWAFLGYQERKKQLLGKDYDPPIYLD